MRFNIIIQKFKKQLMKKGKKSVVTKLFNQILKEISIKGYSPRLVLIGALVNVNPLVVVKSVKIRGKRFSVPFPKPLAQQLNSGISLIIQLSYKKKKNLSLALAEELIASFNGRSSSVQEVETLHQLAIQNKLYSTYRWF